MNGNPDVLNMTFKVLNDGVSDSLINSETELFVDITRVNIFMLLSIPRDENDKKLREGNIENLR